MPRGGRERARWARAAALTAAAGLLVTASTAAAARRFDVGPAPSWVVDPGVPEPGPAAEGESEGARYLLFDHEVLAAPGVRHVYRRTVWRAETTAGVQDASEIAISFDPSYERLVLHHARITRGGRTAWSFSPREVRVIAAEKDLEARLYNGELTATVLLRDLRVGDSVDYAYSLVGENPVLGGRFDAVLWLGSTVPVDLIQRRLVWRRPGPPRLALRAGAKPPSVEAGAEGTAYTWQERGHGPAEAEERTPAWYVPHPRVEVSEFASWEEVARHAAELFSPVEDAAPSIDALARRLRLEGADEDARVLRAVRFVQDEVRYLGLEMGPHSHRPHAPAETLRRRFGDCKDKSALLVAVLRRLGVTAWPALVSTSARGTVEERLPSLFAFDHVIVAIRMGEALVFVDATASEQGGPVRGRAAPPYARALLVDRGSPGFVPIPESRPEAPSTEVEETFLVADWKAPARLEVVTTYRGDDADEMRQGAAREARIETSKRYRDFYEREHASARTLGLPKVEDDRERNVVVVREAYEITDFWREGSHDFRAWLVDEWLRAPKKLERTAPLALAHPAFVKHTLTLRLPGRPDLDPMQETVAGPGFSMDARWIVRGNEARLEYTYRTLRSSLPPAQVKAHVEKVGRAADLVVCRVPGKARSGAAVNGEAEAEDESGFWALAGLGTFAAVALGAWGTSAGVAAARARRRRQGFRSAAAPGRLPAAAIWVSAEAEVVPSGFGGACRCNAGWREVDRSRLRYGDRPMLAVTRRCDRCGSETTTYFRVRDALV